MHALSRAVPGAAHQLGNRAALPAEVLVENATRFSSLRGPGARQCGFTLVELVLVIALSAVVAVMVSTVLSRPLEGFTAQSRRAELVDIGSIALNRMQRDIRMAVPRSLRVSPDNQGLELLLINNVGRYRPNRRSRLAFSGTASSECQGPLDIASGQPRCDVLQVLDPDWQPPSAGWLVAVIVGKQLDWVEGNSGQILPWRDFTRLPNDSDFPGISLIALDMASLSSELTFNELSERRRLYFADRVVGYRCQDGKLLRYEQTGSLQDSLDNGLPAGVSAQVQAGQVSACSFQIDSQASQATLRLSIAQAGEAIRLVQFVQVNNAP